MADYAANDFAHIRRKMLEREEEERRALSGAPEPVEQCPKAVEWVVNDWEKLWAEAHAKQDDAYQWTDVELADIKSQAKQNPMTFDNAQKFADMTKLWRDTYGSSMPKAMRTKLQTQLGFKATAINRLPEFVGVDKGRGDKTAIVYGGRNQDKSWRLFEKALGLELLPHQKEAIRLMNEFNTRKLNAMSRSSVYGLYDETGGLLDTCKATDSQSAEERFGDDWDFGCGNFTIEELVDE